MLSLLKNCGRASGKQQPATIRPSIEALEDRLVQSASSFALHSVTETGGGSAAFFRMKLNDAFYEKTPQGLLQRISAPHTVTDFSAGLDEKGHAAAFAHRNGVMQEYTENGWIKLNEPIKMRTFAAVDNNHLYAVGQNYALWQYTTPHTKTVFVRMGGQLTRQNVTFGGWKKLTAAHTVIGIDAVTQTNGRDVIFGIDKARHLEEFIPGTTKNFVTITSTPVNTFSVGLDASGFANVYTVISKNVIVPNAPGAFISRWTPSGFTTISDSNIDPLTTLSANKSNQVIVNNPAAPFLQSFVPSTGFQFLPSNPNGVRDVSAAGANDVFVIGIDGSLAEYHPSVFGQHWFVYS